VERGARHPPYSTDLSGLALARADQGRAHCEVFERDADDSRKIGYYLHMNADGGEALRRYLPMTCSSCTRRPRA